jgi:hypothetical protein
MIQLNNKSEHKFTDISSEEFREYQTPFGTYKINNPAWLATTENGHRILDESGCSHYVDTRKGFFLSWKVKEGQPHFVK